MDKSTEKERKEKKERQKEVKEGREQGTKLKRKETKGKEGKERAWICRIITTVCLLHWPPEDGGSVLWHRPQQASPSSSRKMFPCTVGMRCL